MPKISKIEIFKVNIPFKFNFIHFKTTRRKSENVFVKISLSDNTIGFGEATPRFHVTGNTQDSTFEKLVSFTPMFLGSELDEKNGLALIKNIAGIENEARCAFELALLDCLGKISNKPIASLLGGSFSQDLFYSFVISSESLFKTFLVAIFAKYSRFKFIKIKVDSKNYIRKIKLCRKIFKKTDLRIDTNGTWNSTEAVEAIKKLKNFRISAVEQPVPKEEVDLLREITKKSSIPIVADESMCTIEDALLLASTKACDIFNVRLSKCGGFFRSLEIIKIAQNNGLEYQIGCHVGESGVLSQAGRHLFAVAHNARYVEGSYSRLLLKRDVIFQKLFPRKGFWHDIEGSGLGVDVNEDILRKYSEKNVLIS